MNSIFKKFGSATVMISLALAGCNAGYTDEGTAEATPTVAVATEAQSATGSTDNIVRVVANTEITNLLQYETSLGTCMAAMEQFSEGLMRLDPDQNVQPGLAESYDVSEDGLTYTFHLRDGLKWSNGDPLTADDFAFEIKTLLNDPNAEYSFFIEDHLVNADAYAKGECDFEDVGVKAADDQTVVFTLKSVCSYFPQLVVMPPYFPLNEKFFESCGDQYGTSVDTLLYCGPFIMTSFDPSVGITFKKNPDYWDASNVKIDGAEMKVIKDSNAQLNAYLAGEVDETPLAATDIPTYKDDPGLTSVSKTCVVYLQFNLEDPVMSNLNIRKAISLAIDRDTLANQVIADGVLPAEGYVNDGIPGADGKTFREMAGPIVSYDSKQAKEYWDKGCEELGGAPESLELLSMDLADHQTSATFIQDSMRQIFNVDVTIKTMTKKGRNDLMDGNNYSFAIANWGADYADGMTYMDLYLSDKTDNGLTSPYRGNWHNDEYNSLIRDSQTTTDTTQHVEDMIKAEKILVSDDVVITPIYYEGAVVLINPKLKGLVMRPSGFDYDFKWCEFK